MANRYWVGGTATWDATAGTKWSLTSGGGGGEAVPTAADDVFFDGASGAVTITLSGARTCLSFNSTGFTGTLAGTGTLTVSANAIYGASATFTNTGTWTFNATSGIQDITSNSKTLAFSITQTGVGGTVRLQDALTSTSTVTLTNGTLNLNNNTLTCDVFSSSNANIRSIEFGTGNITLPGNDKTIFTTATATNLTVTGTPNVNATYSGAIGTRGLTPNTITIGGTEANAFNINITAGTDIIQVSGSRSAKNLNFTGFSGTFNLAGAFYVYGNLTLSSGMSLNAATQTLFMSATSGTQTITSNGKTMDFLFTQNGAGGTVKLIDNMTLGSTRTYTLTNGTLDIDGKTLTTGIFSSSNSNTRTVAMGANGKITVNGGNWTATTSTNLSLTGTGTIDMTFGTAKTFAGGSKVYPYTLNQGGAGTLTITGANTFTNITNTVQPATVTFPASTTTTVSNFGLTGTAGNLITINSSTPGTQATLSDASGTISVDYLSIRDSNAAGGASWYAGANSTNVSNNTGWIFSAVPVDDGVENPYNLRSFTQPRRF